MAKAKRRTKLESLQLELSKVRNTHAKLTGEVSREALKTVQQIDQLMTELGAHLRTLRLNSKLSQTVVSTALGKKSNVMWRVEKKPETIRLSRYAKLLAIYGKAAAALRTIGYNPIRSVAAGR